MLPNQMHKALGTVTHARDACVLSHWKISTDLRKHACSAAKTWQSQLHSEAVIVLHTTLTIFLVTKRQNEKGGFEIPVQNGKQKYITIYGQYPAPPHNIHVIPEALSYPVPKVFTLFNGTPRRFTVNIKARILLATLKTNYINTYILFATFSTV